MARDSLSGEGTLRIPHPRGGWLAADLDRRAGPLTLAFFHGFGSDRKGRKVDAFRRLAREQGWTFLAPEFRGHGESAGEIADLTLSGMVEDVGVALDAVVEPAAPLALVGSSLGGLAVAWWSARHPGRVRANVLVAPAFGFVERFLDEVGPSRAAAWEREGVLAYRNEWLEVPLRWGLVADARAHDEAGLASAYRTDTLVLHGLRDERVPWRVSAEFAERCPHRPLDVVLLGDGDHRLQARADDLGALARPFLSARAR
jgi:pimeloyl-ACP methyl ester carboxylesterase